MLFPFTNFLAMRNCVLSGEKTFRVLVINDKFASTVVCSKHFNESDYVPGCRIRKLLVGAVLTVFELYPSYMVPAAKRPRKDPACRCRPAPRNPLKRKAELPLPGHEGFGALEDVTDMRKCVSTQTNSNDAN